MVKLRISKPLKPLRPEGSVSLWNWLAESDLALTLDSDLFGKVDMRYRKATFMKGSSATHGNLIRLVDERSRVVQRELVEIDDLHGLVDLDLSFLVCLE